MSFSFPPQPRYLFDKASKILRSVYFAYFVLLGTIHVSAQPTCYVAIRNLENRTVSVSAIDVSTKKVLQSTVILTDRVGDWFGRVSPNPSEAGLTAFKGKSKEDADATLEVSVLDLSPVVLRNTIPLGIKREAIGSCPSLRKIFLSFDKLVQLTPQLGFDRIEERTFGFQQPPSLTETIAYNGINEEGEGSIEKADLKLGHVIETCRVSLDPGWRVDQNAKVFPLNEDGSRLLVNSISNRKSYDSHLLVGEVKNGLLRPISMMKQYMAKAKMSPDRREIYGWQMFPDGRIISIDARTLEIRTLVEFDEPYGNRLRHCGLRLELSADSQWLAIMCNGIPQWGRLKNEPEVPCRLGLWNIQQGGMHWIEMMNGDFVGAVFSN